MELSANQLIEILSRISKFQLETFKNFPGICRAGKNNIEEEEFEVLIAEGYLEEKKTDSFGKLFQLSIKAINLLDKQVVIL